MKNNISMKTLKTDGNTILKLDIYVLYDSIQVMICGVKVINLH